jgi:hypothetical protein
VLPFGRLWYGEPNAASNAIGYAEHRSRSHDAVIRVYDNGGNVIQTHYHEGQFKSGELLLTSHRNAFRSRDVASRFSLPPIHFRIALYASWSSGPKLGKYRTQRLVLVF